MDKLKVLFQKLGIELTADQTKQIEEIVGKEFVSAAVMRIVTDRGQLFRNSNGQAVIRWNRGVRQMNENFDRLQVFIDNTIVRHMDAYVPMRTGMLKKSVMNVESYTEDMNDADIRLGKVQGSFNVTVQLREK